MNNDKKMTITSRSNSFKYAFSGLRDMIKYEPNMKIHFIAAVVVIIAGIVQDLDKMQWVALTIVICIVWVAEAFNTAMEKLCDLVCDNKYHPVIKTVKDLSAAGVLLAAITGVIVGVLVFIA